MRLAANYGELAGYRLPTEAEWEYACRAGANTHRYYGQPDDLLHEYAWYLKNTTDRAQPVGMLKPNDFGLFDMHGNVWEWCQVRCPPYPQGAARSPAAGSDKTFQVPEDLECPWRGAGYGNYAWAVYAERGGFGHPIGGGLHNGFRVARSHVSERIKLVGKEMEPTGTTLDDTEFHWTAYRGKVVLVVFWALERGSLPIRMPEARLNYELYHDRGFDVVGINLDKNRQDLVDFLKHESFPWVTLHGSSGRGAKSMAVRYGITHFPTKFLVDRDGKVVATQVRGRALDNSLEQLLGPPYCPTGKLSYIDLQDHANQELAVSLWPMKVPGNDLGQLPRGNQMLRGVRFFIGDSCIHLGGKRIPMCPERVEGIRVGKPFARLYVLHGTQYGTERDVPDGTPIGQYRVHYRDGSNASIPIVCGQDVRDWWDRDNEKPVTRSKVAWRGENDRAKKSGYTIRLYLTKWENPRPDEEVTSIDYLSTKTNAAPFCVAMTVEGTEKAGVQSDR